MLFGRLAILTLITTALLSGQLPAAASRLALRAVPRENPTAHRCTARDLLAPDDDTREQAPSRQVPAELTVVHGEELESKDFATDLVFACPERPHLRVGLAEFHSHSEFVPTSELTLHSLHRLQI